MPELLNLAGLKKGFRLDPKKAHHEFLYAKNYFYKRRCLLASKIIYTSKGVHIILEIYTGENEGKTSQFLFYEP